MKKYYYLLIALAALLSMAACSNDNDYPDKNVLDKPEVTVPSVLESSAIVSWKAIGNATAYIYSLNGGAEQTTDQNTVELNNLEPEKSYNFKVKAQKTNSLYFDDSEYTEITFTTTSHVPVYRVATFADDWDKWYYEYNNNGTVKRAYRLTGDGGLDREWLFAYDGNNITVTGKNNYSMTLNDLGYVAVFVDGSSNYEYTYNEDGYMTQAKKNGTVCSNIVIEKGNIVTWSKFSDGVEKLKVHTYSAVPNVGGAHSVYSESCGVSRWLVETGLFGKASTHCHTSGGWEGSTASAFTFEYDANNCIKQEMKDYDGYVENFFYTYIGE